MKKSHRLSMTIGKLDTLRPFLRALSYGCYHKQAFARRYGVSARSYEDNLSRARFFLPEDWVQQSSHARRQYPTLAGDIYRGAENALARAYGMKSLTPRRVRWLLALLMVLGAAERPLPSAELFDRVWACAGRRGEEAPDASTLLRYVRGLVAQGFLVQRMEGRAALYALAEDPLAGLSSDEAAALAFAVGGYRTWAHLTAPGYFLLRTLHEMHPGVQEPRLPWRCKHASFVRVLDDEVLAVTLAAIAQGRLLSFSYHGKRVTALPARIVTSWADGRQQVEAFTRRSPRAARFTVAQTYRVEDMMDVRMLEKTATAGKKRRVRLQTVRVRFHVPAGGEGLRASLLHRLRARFPEVQIEEDAGRAEKVTGDGKSDGAASGAEALSFVAVLSVQDPVSIFPWLRTFHPHAEILAGADGLRARMKEDLEEALRHYEG